MKVCRHCRDNSRTVNRPRGLCWVCFHTPGVKDRYPSTSKYARRGVVDGHCGRPLPTEPTSHPPGSAEKIEALRARALAGQSLWHPDDADVPAVWTARRAGALAEGRASDDDVPLPFRPCPLCPGLTQRPGICERCEAAAKRVSERVYAGSGYAADSASARERTL